MVHQLWGQRTAGNLLPSALPHHAQHRMLLARGQGCRSTFVPNARRTVRGSAPPARGHRLHGLARHILAQPGIEGDPLAFLDITDKYWKALRNQKHEPEKKGPTVVTYADGPLFPGHGPATTATNGNGKAADGTASGAASSTASVPSSPHDYDVVVCGGTLGLFLATALQLRGWRVAVVEKRLAQGRNQEWNISWGELQVLEELGLLSHEALRSAVVSEFNPIRVGFLGGQDMWVRDVLNLGVQPRRLLEAVRARFLEAGGVIHENTAFKGAVVHPDGLLLKLSPGGRAAPLAVGDTNRPNGVVPGTPTAAPTADSPAPPPAASTAPRSLTTRVLLDCMGHYSDIVKQIRGRVKPDGMCLVVGSCAEGFPASSNTSADLLYSLSHARHDMQLFWEAFPAEGGSARTTYMFAYSDSHPERPTFEQLLDTYFEMLPEYQGVPLEQLRFKRVLFGGFPCYDNGPLPPAFDRVMQIGDASAAQSPLSFGGFGCMMRHLPRLTRGLDQALAEDRLSRGDLAWLQPYQPSLAASWLFQRSMSIGVGQALYPAGYPHTPAYAVQEAGKAGGEGERTAAELVGAEGVMGGAAAEVPLVLGAGAGPGAAFQEAAALAARTAASLGARVGWVEGGRFAAGAADPSDYLEEEGPEGSAAAGGAGSRAVATGSMEPLFDRDFRAQPTFLKLPYSHVNEILGTNFGVMGVLGDRVLRPFLQDTIQLVPLSLSMVGMMLANPVTISRVLLQVGGKTLVRWFGHYGALLAYSLAYTLLRPFRPLVPGYSFQRLLDALEYGSGSDYRYHAPPTAPGQLPAAPALEQQQQQLAVEGGGKGAQAAGGVGQQQEGVVQPVVVVAPPVGVGAAVPVAHGGLQEEEAGAPRRG